MKRRVNVLLALVRGKAIVIAQNPEEANRADVLVGKNVTKRYAVNSLMSTLKAIAL